MTPQERGRKGGKKVAQEYGNAYMRQIGSNGGKKGIQGLAASKFGGSVKEAMSWVRSIGRAKQLEALADIQLRAEIASGAEIASVELPPDDEYEPQHWRERVRSRKESSVDLPW